MLLTIYIEEREHMESLDVCAEPFEGEDNYSFLQRVHREFGPLKDRGLKFNLMKNVMFHKVHDKLNMFTTWN
jgi:hypothetical protein